MESISSRRPRRGRISITAGWAAEGCEACGPHGWGKTVLALDFVACQSKKRANILGIWTACLCSPSSRTHCLITGTPQVTFASLSSPAVMDVRHRRRRLLEMDVHDMLEIDVHNMLVKVQPIIYMREPFLLFRCQAKQKGCHRPWWSCDTLSLSFWFCSGLALRQTRWLVAMLLPYITFIIVI